MQRRTHLLQIDRVLDLAGWQNRCCQDRAAIWTFLSQIEWHSYLAKTVLGNAGKMANRAAVLITSLAINTAGNEAPAIGLP